MTCEEMIYSNDYVDLMVNELSLSDASGARYEKGCLNRISNKISILHAPQTRDPLMNLESVPYSYIPKLYGLMDTSNLDSLGVSAVQNVNQYNLDGKNVIVGVIDTGIDYNNPMFWKLENDKKTSRIVALWDQTVEGFEKSDEKEVLYGTVYRKNKIEEALNFETPLEIVPSVDENGHGTFLAGVAAGNRDLQNDFSGVAPECDIAVVKLKEAKPYLREYFGIEENVPAYQETDLLYAVSFLINLARERKTPISILIGVGSSNGGHFGVTFLERYLEELLKNVGIMVSVPAGNEGNARLHYQGRFDEGEEVQQVELNVAEGQQGITLEFWGMRPTTFALGLISPQGDRVERIPPRFGQEEFVRLLLADTTVYVAYQLIETYTGNELIFVRIVNPVPGLWRFLIYANEGRKREYDIWLPLRQFQKADTYFVQPNPDNTVTNPGNGNLTMTVSAYNHLNGSAYVEAGRGYNSFGQVVPDLAAPGISIMGPGLRNNYVNRTGTSVAAALSAGIMALFFQWTLAHPEIGYLYAEQIKSLFLKNAIRIPENTYPNPIVGYGYMNIETVFDAFRVVS